MADQPENVVFDIGNVLVGWDPAALYRDVFKGDEEKVRWFLHNICNMDWNLEQDRGRSFADGVKVLAARHPEWAREIAAYHERWHETITGPIDGSVSVLKTLHETGVPVYAITNFNDEKFAQTVARFDFLKLFRDTVVSATERVIKPEPEIFAILCRRNGLSPASCVFIDDNAHNVQGARDFGMHAIHFTGADTMRRELAGMGLLAG